MKITKIPGVVPPPPPPPPPPPIVEETYTLELSLAEMRVLVAIAGYAADVATIVVTKYGKPGYWNIPTSQQISQMLGPLFRHCEIITTKRRG